MSEPTLHVDELAVLRMTASGADVLPPGIEPATAAAALDWLLDNGFVTFNSAVGSVPVVTNAGWAYLEAHDDE